MGVEQVDSYRQGEGWTLSAITAVVEFSDWTYTTSPSSSFDWFDRTQANNLMSTVRERGHAVNHNFNGDLALISEGSSESMIDHSRWEAMQNFYIDKCKWFIHPNHLTQTNDLDSSDFTTVDAIGRTDMHPNYPTFAEVETHTYGLEPSTHRDWFEFCMHVGLTGTYTKSDGTTETRWGFQYADESTNWLLSRPGHFTDTNTFSNATRKAQAGDAITKAVVPDNTGTLNTVEYSKALMEDLKKCIDFNFKLKYLFNGIGGRKGPTTLTHIDIRTGGVGFLGDSLYYVEDAYQANATIKGYTYDEDLDDRIAANSGNASDNIGWFQVDMRPDVSSDYDPVPDTDGNHNMGTLENTFEQLRDKAVTNKTWNTYNFGTHSSIDFSTKRMVGSAGELKFNFYADFDKSMDEPEFWFTRAEDAGTSLYDYEMAFPSYMNCDLVYETGALICQGRGKYLEALSFGEVNNLVLNDTTSSSAATYKLAFDSVWATTAPYGDWDGYHPNSVNNYKAKRTPYIDTVANTSRLTSDMTTWSGITLSSNVGSARITSFSIGPNEGEETGALAGPDWTDIDEWYATPCTLSCTDFPNHDDDQEVNCKEVDGNPPDCEGVTGSPYSGEDNYDSNFYPSIGTVTVNGNAKNYSGSGITCKMKHGWGGVYDEVLIDWRESWNYISSDLFWTLLSLRGTTDGNVVVTLPTVAQGPEYFRTRMIFTACPNSAWESVVTMY